MYHSLTLRTRRSILLLFLLVLTQQSFAAIYTINTNSYSVLSATISGAAPGDQVQFNIPGPGPHVFLCGGAINVPSGITIDGTTQPGYVAASGSTPATMMIVFQRSGGPMDGLLLSNANSVRIKGIAFVGGYTNAISITGTTSYDNIITACYLGIGADGVTVSSPANSYGVTIGTGAHDNTVGGVADADRNVITGNTFGVNLSSAGTNNRVLGNFIGVDAICSANPTLYNAVGVNISVSDGTIVGGSGIGRNIISGNYNSGVMINGSDNCVVKGNYIGTDYAGMAPRPNVQAATGGAVYITDGSFNVIGGTSTGEANVISGNNAGTAPAILIADATSVSNSILGNYLGIASDGVSLLNNSHNIVINNGASNNFVGNGTASGMNIIAHSAEGVLVSGSTTQGNRITYNTFLCNTTGIVLAAGAHSNHPVPVISTATSNSVSGTGFPGDSVEVYYGDDLCGNTQGQSFIGRALANASGVWSLGGISITAGEYVVALQYSPSTGSTSIFSTSVLITGGSCSISGVSAGIDLEVCTGTNLVLQGSATTGNLKGTWSTPIAGVGNFSDVHDQNSAVSFTSTMTVPVIWTVENTVTGCIGDDTIMVTIVDCIDPSIEVYNVLSPNNDGINDILKIMNIDFYEDATVTIYNRWGDKVYHASGYDNLNIVFTGTGNVGGNKNKDLPDGTYYYHVEFGGNTENGSLEIKK